MTVSSANSASRMRRTSQNTQYTYNLAGRLHTVHTYPVLSPQGATIITYGHEDGLTIVWRGGKRFKESAHDGTNTHQNGNPPDDAVMVIDSDDETATKTPAHLDKPQFEDATDEDDTYPEITQKLDLYLGFAVSSIATLPMAPCAAEDAVWNGLDILKEKMVIAVSCGHQGVYVITLPLTPPSPASMAREELHQNLLAGKPGNGKWGETMIKLSGQEKPISALAITTANLPSPSERSKYSERWQAGSTKPRIVVAAHSREAAGTLHLWDVSLDSAANSIVKPFQTEFLPQPLTSISFNPTHSTQLLCNASHQAVRIYDYALPSMSDDQSEGPLPSQGSWLISLYAPFARPSTQRKPIVAASWIAHGRAILVLLADGQWGIWDIEGLSPQGASLFSKHSSGIHGGALTAFSASGFVPGTSPLRSPVAQRVSDQKASDADYAPMSPGTRKSLLTTRFGPDTMACVRGGIVVTPLPARAATATADESVVLWIGSSEHVIVIPEILKFWAQQRKGSGAGIDPFSRSETARMIRLNDLAVGLMGESCIDVGAICIFGGRGASDKQLLPIEVLVCGESRLVVVRESEAVFGTKIGGIMGQRRRLDERARDKTAIIAYPRPDQRPSQLYNLTTSKRKLSDTVPADDENRSVPGDTLLPSTEAETETGKPTTKTQTGFAFLDSLNAAADALDSEEEVEERDVEEELLDIMDIDRTLDDMDYGGERATKRVAFS